MRLSLIIVTSFLVCFSLLWEAQAEQWNIVLGNEHRGNEAIRYRP